MAKYFHGRTAEQNRFLKVLNETRQFGIGASVVIQGPQGSGKTALLDQLAKVSIQEHFRVATVSTSALEDPKRLAVLLFDGPRWERAFEINTWSISVPGITPGGGPGIDATLLGRVLEKATRSSGLVLLFDEAQNIVNAKDPSAAAETVQAIHNGSHGLPVVLLCGGLSDTVARFRRFGITRFDTGYVSNLGALEDDSARAVIEDWLVNEGNLRSTEMVQLAEQIQSETHRWPQHIIGYVDPICKRLRHSGGSAPDTDALLQDGRNARESYYRTRLGGLHGAYHFQLASISKRMGSANAVFTTVADRILQHDLPDVNDRRALIDALIHSGILVAENGQYSIPIPSMKSWLDHRLQVR